MTKRAFSLLLSVLLVLTALPLLPLSSVVKAEDALSPVAQNTSMLLVDKVVNDFDDVPTSGTATVGNYTVPIGIGKNTDTPTSTDYSANSTNTNNTLTIEDGVLKDTLAAKDIFSLSVFVSPKSLTRGDASPTADSVALQFHVDFTGITSVEAGTKVTFEPEIYLSSGRSSGDTAYCIPKETFYYIPDATAENPNPEMQICSTGTSVLFEHGAVYGYAGQSGTVIVPFDAWDTEVRKQFAGVCDIWNFYKKNVSTYHNRSAITFDTNNTKYAAGDVFAIDDICWLKKPAAEASDKKQTYVVEDFENFTPSFNWSYQYGNYSAYSNPDGAVTANEIAIENGRFAITPNSKAVDGTRFTSDIESELWDEKYESFAFDLDLSETTGNKRIRMKFLGYTPSGATTFGVYNTTITLIAEDGTVSTLSLGESSHVDSDWGIPEGFKGTVVVPTSGVRSGSANITDTFDELVFSFEVLGWLAADNGKTVYIDNFSYLYSAEALGDDMGTDFSGLSHQLYEAGALIKDTVRTAEAYFKTDKNATQSIIATKFGSVSRHGYLVNLCVSALGQLELTVGNKTVAVTNVCLNDGNWHHAAVVTSDDGTSVSAYIDGVLAKTVAVSGFAVPELATYLPVTVGCFMPAESRFYTVFDGSIANVRLWSDARTAEELAANANVSVGADAEGLIAEWMLSGENFTAETTGKYDLKEFYWNIDTENELFAQYNRDAAEGEFTIIFLPDTQTIIKNFEAQVPDIFDWIIANAERLNIKTVVSLGDIIEHGNATASDEVLDKEMATLSAQYARLTEAGIPWVATPGDHDYDYFGDRSSTYYDKYFTKDMLVDNDWFELGGLYDENSLLNSYYIMRPNDDVEYMIFSLEVQPRDEVIAWANEIIAKNPQRRVILATHKYMNYAYCKRHTTVSYNHGNPGETVWQELVSQHKNIDMILCGHNETTGIYAAYDTGVNGNQVLQVNCDMQNTDQSYKTIGATVIARFNADGSQVSFNLYSAHHNIFIDNHSNDITFDLGKPEDELSKPLADDYYGGSEFKVVASKDANSFPSTPGGYISASSDTGASVNPEYYGWSGTSNATYEWDEETESGKFTAIADCSNSASVCAIIKDLPLASTNMVSFHVDATGVSTADGNFTSLIALTYNRAGHTVKGNSDIYFIADGSDTVETIHVGKSSATWNHRIQLKAGVSGTYYIPTESFGPATKAENGYDEPYGTNWVNFSDLLTNGKNWWFEDGQTNNNYQYCYLYFYKTTLANGDVFYVDDISYDTVVSFLEELEVTAEGFDGTVDGNAHGITVNAPEGATVTYGTTEGEYTLTEVPTFTEVGEHTVYFKVEKNGFTPFEGKATVKISGLAIEETAKQLTITDSLEIGYKLDSSVLDDYSAIRAQYKVGDVVTEINDYDVDENGNIVFNFKGISPKNVSDTITATYYVTKDGVELPSAENTYSVAKYCYNLINNYTGENADEVVKVCKELLNFASASQVYHDYNKENLVNADLADEDKTLELGRTPQSITAFDPFDGEITAKFKSASVNLKSNVAIRFVVEAEDISDMRVKLAVGDEVWYVFAKNFVPVEGYTNRYYVYFNKLGAAAMSDEVVATIENNKGVALGKTLHYSIESYAASKWNSEDTALQNLVKAMMCYGDASKALEAKIAQ